MTVVISAPLTDDAAFLDEVGAILREYPNIFNSERTYYRYWSERDFSPFFWRMLAAPDLFVRLGRAVESARARQEGGAPSDTSPVYDNLS